MGKLCEGCGRQLANAAGSGLYCDNCGEPVATPESTALRYSWTQPACNTCWNERNPDRRVHRMLVSEEEVCVYCGNKTKSGIYVRVDPRDTSHPTLLK